MPDTAPGVEKIAVYGTIGPRKVFRVSRKKKGKERGKERKRKERKRKETAAEGTVIFFLRHL